MRAKKKGYSTGYAKYVQLYDEKVSKTKGRYELAPKLSRQEYRLKLDEMKADSLVDKKLGIISKNTSVNFNRQIINEAQFESSSKQANAVRKGLIKFIEERDIKINPKDIRLKDLRARNLNNEELKGVLESFWSEVATAYAEGWDKRDVAMTFFDSE